MSLSRCSVVLLAGLCPSAYAVDLDQLIDMDIGQLQSLKVYSASGVPEQLRHAPAALVVITAEDIRRRGYDNLAEVLQDVPGLDLAVTGGTNYAHAYQRGYRSPFGQRTLLLVDGVVNNDLWSQAPDLSRQYPLQLIERIEILYGPASAVHGANAFAGVIQLITRSPEQATARATGDWQVRAGSYHSRSLDGSYSQALGEVKLTAGLRLFASDEPGLDDYPVDPGFSGERWLGDPRIWGPILKLEHDGRPLGRYHDPADDAGLLVNAAFRAWKAGLLWWRAGEGVGMEYAGDHAQVNEPWRRERRHLYVEHRDTPLGTTLTTRLTVRDSREWGEWGEAEPDWHPGQAAYSYVSLSHWNTTNRAGQVEQKLELPAWAGWQWLGGWKLERRRLTRAYGLCGYWEPESYCPAAPAISAGGPEGFGPWVVHSSADTVPDAPAPSASMPTANTVAVRDRSLYLQGVYSWSDYRASLGLLHDRHSLYGHNTSPRLALIRELSARTTLKALYGKAWQEPATIQVYGGWNGRDANENLRPEQALNRELIWMHARPQGLHELSLYQADYRNAIREDAVNAASRRVRGGEYRGRFNAGWFDRDWTGYLYYTYTEAIDAEHYDAQSQQWQTGSAEIGDIARHKIQAGVDVALTPAWRLHLRARYAGARTPYATNPLRAQGTRLDSYVVGDLNLRFQRAGWHAALTVNNLFNTAYVQPGIASADAGLDTSQRALGYYSSVLPQPGRSLYLSLGADY